MNDCFKDIVGLKGCSTEVPFGGYVDDIYVNKSLLASSIDGIESVNDWFEAKLGEVINSLILDIRTMLEIDVRSNIQTISSAGVRSVECSNLTLEGSNTNTTIDLTIKAIRGFTNPPLFYYVNGKKYNWTGEAVTYTGNLLSLYVDSIEPECYSLISDTCCKPCGIPCGVIHSTTDGGFIFEATLRCDFESWLCQFKEILIPLIKYQTRIEIAVAMQSSSNVSMGLFTEDQADLVISRNEEKYDKALKSALKVIRSKAHDNCCFDCVGFAHGVYTP